MYKVSLDQGHTMIQYERAVLFFLLQSLIEKHHTVLVFFFWNNIIIISYLVVQVFSTSENEGMCWCPKKELTYLSFCWAHGAICGTSLPSCSAATVPHFGPTRHLTNHAEQWNEPNSRWPNSTSQLAIYTQTIHSQISAHHPNPTSQWISSPS